MKLLFLLLLIIIQTDGILSTNEWNGAEQIELGDNNKVLLKKESDILYVALNSPNSFWAHLYLSDGKQIKVMHASAALGAIKFSKENSLWRTTDKAFTYELRDREFNASTMDAYFSKHQWVANNNNLGDRKTIEAKIDLKDFKPAYFACVIATSNKYYSYPIDLKDNTILKKLVEGYAVDSLTFDPKRWRKL